MMTDQVNINNKDGDINLNNLLRRGRKIVLRHKILLDKIDNARSPDADLVDIQMTRIAFRYAKLFNEILDIIKEDKEMDNNKNNDSVEYIDFGDNTENNKYGDKIDNKLTDTGLEDKLDRLLQLFEDNVKSIAVSEKIKSPDRITNARHDVNTDDLIADYQAGNSLSDIGRKYDMTYNGVKRRLEKAGVYHGKYRDYKGNKYKPIKK